ncbi:hypothetical protein Droror1_Dr00011651 [Drosera rotundifolia]
MFSLFYMQQLCGEIRPSLPLGRPMYWDALYIKFLKDDHGTVWRAMKASPASVILMFYCFVALWFVGGLTGFHSYLIGSNQTTYENFRYRADNRRNIFDKGCFSNFVDVFCSRPIPSKNDFRAFMQEEAPRPPTLRPMPKPIDESSEDRRAKVEDDLEIGNDILKLSRRHNYEDIGDINPSKSKQLTNQISGSQYTSLLRELQAVPLRSEMRRSSWVRRSGSFETLSPRLLGLSSIVTEPQSSNHDQMEVRR